VHELIGVYSGRIHDDADVGVVWKRDAVREIVEHGVRPENPWVAPLEVPLSSLTEPPLLPKRSAAFPVAYRFLQRSAAAWDRWATGQVPWW
jgi:hypothetical protein